MELLFFILGILFVQYLVPIFESLGSLILTSIEVKKVKQQDIINQYEIKMRQDEILSNKKIQKPKIGFQNPNEEENEEEDD